MRQIIIALLLGALAPAALAQEESVGKRPYEMDWARRTEDQHRSLVDFEDLSGWKAEATHSEATFTRSREQQLFGQYVGKLVYRGTGPGPKVRMVPPESVKVAQAFDSVSLWIYGNNWGYSPNPSTPAVAVSVLFEDTEGKEFGVPLYVVNWEEWHLLYKRLTPEQIERVAKGARLKAIEFAGGRNKQDRKLYFDSLCVFTEQLAPLKFEPRPARPFVLPGQSPGTNAGPGTLPFPTRAETILPSNVAKDYTNAVQADQSDRSDQTDRPYTFLYQGPDGALAYRLAPKSGTWSDITARWTPKGGRPGPVLQPCAGGGAYLQTPDGPKPPEKAEPLGTTQAKDAVVSRWRLSNGAVSAEVLYTYRIWGKSLVIEVAAAGGQVGEVRYGRALGLVNPRVVTNCFYPADGGRPAVAVSGTPAAPLFLTGNTDWYLTNSSTMFASNVVDKEGVLYNGGTRYIPRTDGKRNDCAERFFITVSPRYEECLPTIPNPKSPWMHVTGTRVWRAHGAGNRENDAAHWTECHRWGMTEVVVTDHETGWRDGGESFTFRIRPAPGKGGDKGQFDYARLMQDKLGFVYGPYNNYTDFSPVNEYWHPDMVGRTPDNQLQHAWMRCYAPKPARAVEYCARLAPIIQGKFKFSTAYCDVHTAVAPWHRVDYDARVPGAGTMAAVFYSYGEIMLHQKKAWNGPVYSEGNHHSFYSGLTDGNYGQDQAYRPAENPWLVDFDLRKMHDLGCNFGMGAPDMFYAGRRTMGAAVDRDAYVDRFLAATVAFGHPGFLVYDGGVQNALRSYYMLQQLHSGYCLASAAEIRYANEKGALLDTSAAVASGAHARSQVVTRYSDGTVTAANGSPTQRLVANAYGRSINLPPNGYCGWTADGKVEVLSSDPRGHRSDYAATPAYLYVDGRGRFVRFPKAAGSGIGICRILPGGKFEVLLHKDADCGFAIPAASAVALDKERKEIGPARLRTARGYTYVVPVEGAFSYILAGMAAPAGAALSCARDEVVPGERVTIRGKQTYPVQIPQDARPGQRIWMEREGGWIDFTVVEMAGLSIALERNTLRFTLDSHLPAAQGATLTVDKQRQALRLEPGRPATASVELGAPTEVSADALNVEVRAGEMVQRVSRGLRTIRETRTLMPMPAKWFGGMCMRGGKEQFDFGRSGAHVHPQAYSCNEVEKQSLAMHPPWMGGVGYTFALYEPMKLPGEPAAAFRAVVGKGDGSDLGDGILYKLIVVDAAGAETVAAEQSVKEHRWTPIEADLSRWAGKEIRLKLVADVGPADDSSGDWACWADQRIETLNPVLYRVLDSDSEAYRHVPGPYPVPGVTEAELRKAKSGWLRYDGKGLSGTGERYGTFAVLNGVELGNLAPAGGGEDKGIFVEKVGVPLTPQAIAKLATHNKFEIRNPGQDCFSVRRFWLDLVLADGRKCSSEISAATFTQPADWAYAEGLGVGFAQNITVEIWFAK